MKLVADVDKIQSNLVSLSSSVEEFSSAVNSYNGASINCSLEEVSGILNDYKTSIGQDLSNLDTSSNEYKNLVDECCNEYKTNCTKVMRYLGKRLINVGIAWGFSVFGKVVSLQRPICSCMCLYRYRF